MHTFLGAADAQFIEAKKAAEAEAEKVKIASATLKFQAEMERDANIYRAEGQRALAEAKVLGMLSSEHTLRDFKSSCLVFLVFLFLSWILSWFWFLFCLILTLVCS